jgi:hypothetical protein
MKKLLVAMMTLLATTSAFAAVGSKVQPNATFQFGVGGAASGPTTTNNDDSCDISVAPAATLLLPYFEVDFNAPATTARTTLFTITNTSARPQIAHVTIWTDWSFPALDFNIFLTGYDVQAINLYDVLARGLIGTIQGTSIAEQDNTGEDNPTDGSTPYLNTQNPNFLGNVTSLCAPGRLPGSFASLGGGALLADLRQVLTTGRSSGAAINCGTTAATQVGSNHGTNAIGYITVDVAATCSLALPTTPGYFTSEILFDNVLIGDYQDINPNAATGNFAGGNPMVHIRAIPEGGPAGTIPAGVTNLPYTFYDRYTAGATPAVDRRIDRRQPLPSTFAARYIQGGTTDFQTRFKIWREGFTGSTTGCTANAYSVNSAIGIAESVRFDEHENATVLGSSIQISPPLPGAPGLPETSQTPSSSSTFPTLLSPQGDIAGWMYLNLNNGGSAVYSNPAAVPVNRPGFAGAGTSTVTNRQSQNWVIVSMFAEGRYSVDFDAAWLGNGCSPAPVTSVTDGSQIGPAGGTPVCPAGASTCTPGSVNYPGTNVTP